MSAPQTNIEKQQKRHRGPLTGIVAVVLFALILLVLLTFFVVGRGDTPQGAEIQIDGRTGEAGEPAVTVIGADADTGSDAATAAGNVDTGTPTGTATIGRPAQPVTGTSD